MEKKYKILIVDDTEINRSLLADMLGVDYEIVEAANGLEAIALLNNCYDEISLMLLDIVMPEMDGFEVLAAMKKSGWIESVPVITISAETSSAYIDQAYDLGATDYISRPFDEKTVQRRVKNTIMLYAKQKMLEGMVTEQILEKEKNNYLMVEILSTIVEFRNGESGLHVLHIRTITEILLKKLLELTDQYHLTASQVTLIVNASALHDIGKISIPESILNKPGKLTKEEFEVMKTHSMIGAQIMENAPYRQEEELIQIAHDICRWHHERYDGKGYPDGLKGEEIPIAAQVVALADVYDALTSIRVYKPPFTHEEAMEMILRGECGAFSPLLLQCLIETGSTISKAVKDYSIAGKIKPDTQQITTELLANGHPSNRTLALLEQERTKYQFFASMSKEIQYEFNEHMDILSFSEWGAAQLGVKELIVHPLENEELHKVISKEDCYDLFHKLHQVTPTNPVVTENYCLNIRGEKRWHKVIARPLWVGEEQTEITGNIGKFIDIHEEYLELDALKQMATQDSLTKLHNRRSIQEIIEKALPGKHQKFALILFDLDHFKNANDNYGHLFGDSVLVFVATMLLKSIRKEDIAARIGGDEFLIFMEYKDDIVPLVRRIFEMLTKQFHGFQISVSMGIALCPENGTHYEQLFHCADQALYLSKQNGRNQFSFYNQAIQDYLSVLSPIDNELDASQVTRQISE